MIINFSVSNFLSFNDKQSLSMEAGKARKHTHRLYKNRSLRVLKFMSLFGGNATGKSNLIKGINFMRQMVIDGLPRGFSDFYFREDPSNEDKKSEFLIEVLLNNKRYEYGFSILLSKGAVKNEHLYRIQGNGVKKCIYVRNIEENYFEVGELIKNKKNRDRFKIYGDDSLLNTECLFLNMMNQGKAALYTDNEEIQILKELFDWFKRDLNINEAGHFLSTRPFYTEFNIDEVREILKALGLGITDFCYVDVPSERIQNIIPKRILEDMLGSLEKRSVEEDDSQPGIALKSNKEFYIFLLDEDKQLNVQTIAFQHEKKGIFFELDEESDGTTRLIDLVEVLLSSSKDQVFIIDEIDRGLHPVMITNLIKAFLALAESRETQLIVTTHESRLLDNDLLRSDEVNFVVKDTEGASSIKKLEDFNLRSDKNVFTAFVDGTLDKINPNIDYDTLLKVVNGKYKEEN